MDRTLETLIDAARERSTITEIMKPLTSLLLLLLADTTSSSGAILLLLTQQHYLFIEPVSELEHREDVLHKPLFSCIHT